MEVFYLFEMLKKAHTQWWSSSNNKNQIQPNNQTNKNILQFLSHMWLEIYDISTKLVTQNVRTTCTLQSFIIKSSLWAVD